MTTQETCNECANEAIVSGEMEETECSECGSLATTELTDASGVLWPLCANCDVWWRESEAEREEEAAAMRGVCQSCCTKPVTCRFVHLRKGVFYLCDDCFGWADHEDDYLDYCEHPYPEGDPGQTNCDLCRRRLPAPSWYCTCASPTTQGFERINCRSCDGRIRYGCSGLHSTWDAREAEDAEYDWGEAEEGDFPAEDPEPEDSEEQEQWPEDDDASILGG